MDKNKIIQAATKYVQKGQFDKAISEYAKILREDPRDVRILLKVGELHQKRGDDALAAQTLLQVAESYSQDGFFLKAVAVYKQILKLDPTRVDVNIKLAELYQQLGLMSDAMAQFQLVANHHERANNTSDLLNVVRRMVDLDPDNLASRIKLAEMFARDGLQAEALTEFRRAAGLLKTQNRIDDYVKVAERIVFLEPADLALTRELANVHLARGDTKRALAKLQACFKTDPRDTETLHLLARAFQELGQTSKTVAVYKELAKILADTDQVDDERSTWRKVLELAPDDPDARAALAQRPAASAAVPPPPPAASRPAAASPRAAAPAAAARAGSTASPPPAPAGAARSAQDPVVKLLTETDVYVKYGLHDKALDHLKKVFALEPDNLDAHEKAAELLLTAGNHAAGHEELATLCKLCVDQDQLERGKHHFRRLLAIAPHLPVIAELMDALGGPDEEPLEVSDAAIVVEPMLAAVPYDEPATSEMSLSEEHLDPDATRDMILPGVEEELVLGTEVDEEVVDEPLFAGATFADEDEGEEIELEAEVGEEIVEEDVAVEELPGEDLPEADIVEPTPGPEDLDAAWSLGGEPEFVAEPEPEEFEPEVEHEVAAEVEAVVDDPDMDSTAETPGPDPGTELPFHLEPPPQPELRRTAQPASENDWGLDDDDLEEINTELEEADFFIAQDMLDEAEEICRSILFRAPGHDVATARLAEIEARRSPPAATGEASATFDLAAELESELGPASGGAPAEDDFQYSAWDVLEEFKRGVSLTVKPEDVETHYDLGIAYKEMGLVNEAVGEFEVALAGSRGKAREADCVHMIGLCKALLGEPGPAIDWFHQALALPTLDDEAERAIRFELASAYEAAGDPAEALYQYGKVARVDPRYRDVGQAVARLQAAGAVAASHEDSGIRQAAGDAGTRTGGAARKIGYV